MRREFGWAEQVLAAGSGLRRRLGFAPAATHPDTLDPHRHTPIRVRLEEEAWRAEMTPGHDESHTIPGHPHYRPGGPR